GFSMTQKCVSCSRSSAPMDSSMPRIPISSSVELKSALWKEADMSEVDTPSTYRILDTHTVPAFLAGLPGMRARLGGTPEGWQVHEVGDGNLNLVFIVRGTTGSVCVKQALPYVRVAGAAWPMTLERAFFEASYYSAIAPFVGGLIPEIYHYDPALYCT